MELFWILFLIFRIKIINSCTPCTCFEIFATCAGQLVIKLPENKYLQNIQILKIYNTLIRNISSIQHLKSLKLLQLEKNVFLNCQDA